ncbi:PepSY domain-containing protein [Novosphingobium decolorationis]|uniref:PepSY domain-containing protein n=1 Tax=Novosphingobium decolorationis TaxID=2698673 RepID=A0ABX8E0W1_9SPHN|nr:PepSY domain-containing protein [Novosphingobium decolorationis]QVM82770.1 PepSY domain-containing protein [Novosphingobium decolorationis]
MALPRSRKQKLHILGSRLHKWLAVCVGIQVLLWMGSGAIMSWLKIEHVRSEHVIARTPGALPADAPVPSWLANDGTLVAVTTRAVNGQSVIEVRRRDGSAALHDPVSGRRLSPLSARTASEIAQGAWKGAPTDVQGVLPVRAPVGTEYGGPFPAWQVTFADPDRTRLYIDASSGAVLAARSDTWRVFDLVWGLHIMDWTLRERINSWWLFVFALGGTAIALSGFVLLANRFPRLPRPRKRR